MNEINLLEFDPIYNRFAMKKKHIHSVLNDLLNIHHCNELSIVDLLNMNQFFGCGIFLFPQAFKRQFS